MKTNPSPIDAPTDSVLGFSARPDSGRRFLPYALLLSATFALYGTTLYFNFVWDDIDYVLGNYQIRALSPTRLWAIWRNPVIVHGHYAPLNHTFLALLHSVSAMNPFGYHLGQLLVHAVCLCLLYLVLEKVESSRVALLSCLLFAVHPANIETVAWISETKSTLAFLFFLLSFQSFLRLRASERSRDMSLCAVFLILSMLAKINTIVAPVIFLLYDYWKGFSFHPRRVRFLIGLFSISAVFAAIHLASFASFSRSGVEYSYYGGLGVHLANLPLLLLFYIRMTIFPYSLSAWHMFTVYERFTWQIAAGWIALLAIAWMLYRSNRSIQFWGLWFFVFLAPVLQIIPFPIWVAERYLYIPAIGLFVLGSRLFYWVWERLGRPWRRLGWELAVGAVLLAYAWQTRAHLPVWKNDLVFWEATAKTCMTSPFCHSSLGLALLQAGETERGVKELIRAVEIRAAPRYLITLGDGFTLGQDYRQAVIAYSMAREQGGPYITADFYSKLARAYLLAGQFEQAARAVQTGWEINSDAPSLLVVNGFLQWRQGHREQAKRSLMRALAQNPQASNTARFINDYWGNAAEVGRLLADLGPLQSEAAP